MPRDKEVGKQSLDPSQFMKMINGFHRVNWGKARAWIENNLSDEFHTGAECELVAHWLEKMRESLGANYRLLTEESISLLSTHSASDAELLVRFAVKARDVVGEYLRPVRGHSHRADGIILSFGGIEEYYTYVSHFFPEGHYGLSGGVFLSEGYPHIVLVPSSVSSQQHVLAHEMTHALLHELLLPDWLEEGMAQILEATVLGWSTPQMDHEIVARHLHYWNEERIQYFWTGTAFSLPDEGQELAYSLAEVMVRNISADHAERFHQFVAAAKRDDAGASAALEHLGVQLSKCVSLFLGEGRWEPDVEAIRDAMDDPPTEAVGQ